MSKISPKQKLEILKEINKRTKENYKKLSAEEDVEKADDLLNQLDNL